MYLEGFAILQAQSGQGIADDDTQVLPLLKGCPYALCIAPATSTHTRTCLLLLRRSADSAVGHLESLTHACHDRNTVCFQQ